MALPKRPCAAAVFWLACALLRPAPAAFAQLPHEVREGVFIVATENLADSRFRETVILITQRDATGTMGLAVNRPTEIPLREAFPSVETLHDRRDTLFLGGPVSPSAVFSLVRTDRPGGGMKRVGKGVYFANGVMDVARHPPQSSPAESSRAFAGYTGWAPGQLEAEIARGDWVLALEDPALAFSEDLKSLWKRLLEIWSGRWV